MNVVLDDVHGRKLRRLAERTYMQPGTLARSLLSAAIDQVEPDDGITGILDSIPGAWQRTQEGMRAAEAGDVVPLEDV